jgi:hypothetical protein
MERQPKYYVMNAEGWALPVSRTRNGLDRRGTPSESTPKVNGGSSDHHRNCPYG